MTKIARALDLNGWVLYDGNCPLCTTSAARVEKILTRRGFDLAPLQAPWVAECFDLPVCDPSLKSGTPSRGTRPPSPSQMLVLSAEGKVFGGMDGILFIARSVWWAWPLCLIAQVPLVRRSLRKGYGWLAAHRMCFSGQCSIQAHH